MGWYAPIIPIACADPTTTNTVFVNHSLNYDWNKPNKTIEVGEIIN
jgi:hypothetical protein